MGRVPELFLRACAVSAVLLGAAFQAAAGCSLINASSDCSPACDILKRCGVLSAGDCGLYCASAVSGAPLAGCLDQLNAQNACAQTNAECSAEASASCVDEVKAFSQCMEDYCAQDPNAQGCPGEGGDGGAGGAGDGGKSDGGR